MSETCVVLGVSKRGGLTPLPDQAPSATKQAANFTAYHTCRGAAGGVALAWCCTDCTDVIWPAPEWRIAASWKTKSLRRAGVLRAFPALYWSPHPRGVPRRSQILLHPARALVTTNCHYPLKLPSRMPRGMGSSRSGRGSGVVVVVVGVIATMWRCYSSILSRRRATARHPNRRVALNVVANYYYIYEVGGIIATIASGAGCWPPANVILDLPVVYWK